MERGRAFRSIGPCHTFYGCVARKLSCLISQALQVGGPAQNENSAAAQNQYSDRGVRKLKGDTSRIYMISHPVPSFSHLTDPIFDTGQASFSGSSTSETLARAVVGSPAWKYLSQWSYGFRHELHVLWRIKGRG